MSTPTDDSPIRILHLSDVYFQANTRLGMRTRYDRVLAAALRDAPWFS